MLPHMAVMLQAIDACLLHMQVANTDAIIVFGVETAFSRVYLQAHCNDAMQSSSSEFVIHKSSMTVCARHEVSGVPASKLKAD